MLKKAFAILHYFAAALKFLALPALAASWAR